MTNENGNSPRNEKKPSSIDDALKVLDEALSGGNGPALQDLVSSEYRHLKSAIGDFASAKAAPAQEFLSQFAAPLGAYGTESYEKIAEAATVGMEEARRIGGEVDRSVRANPWPYLGGIAVGTLALGLIIGRAHASPPNTQV